MIEVENLTREFKNTIKTPGVIGSLKSFVKPKKEKVIAVNNISFHVPRGEILGFIGPNGAGKSTVIKMLTGILTPTKGKCSIDGKIPQKNRKRYVKDIGVVFGQRTQLWWDLPLSETYTVLKEIYEIDDEIYKRNIAFFNEILDLNDFISNPVRTLSLGQRMRADIAAALLHNPKVLFLDEPTIGLDVVVKDNIRNAIKTINEESQTTVVLTTHDLSDIEFLANRIMMIDKGNIMFDGEIDELKNRYGQMKEIIFELENKDLFHQLDYQTQYDLMDRELLVSVDGPKVNVKFNSAKVSASDMIMYTLNRVHVKDINVKNADIEDIVKKMYQQGGGLNV